VILPAPRAPRKSHVARSAVRSKQYGPRLRRQRRDRGAYSRGCWWWFTGYELAGLRPRKCTIPYSIQYSISNSAWLSLGYRARSKGPAQKKPGDPRGGWVGQSTKKD
jgi:hypothetical protein